MTMSFAVRKITSVSGNIDDNPAGWAEDEYYYAE